MSLLARLGVLLVAMGAVLALPSRPTLAATTVNINVGDFWFCDSSHYMNVCTTNVSAGDTVVWHFSSFYASHTTTSNTLIWDSGQVPDGGTYMRTFSSPGTFAYHCNIHPTLMMGTIVVTAPPVGGIARLPDAANGSPAAAPASSGSSVGLIAGSAAIAAGLVALGSAAWYAWRRRVS